MNFDELQSSWQQKEAPKDTNLTFEHDTVMTKIVRLQKQTIFVGLFVSVCFAIVFIGMGLIWNEFNFTSWTYHVGISLIFIDMLIALGFIWSLVISWKNKTLDLDSYTFINQTLKKLHRRKWLARVIIPLYLLALVLGINLIYIETLADNTMGERVLIHGLVSLATLGGGMLTAYFGRKKDKKRIDPLIEKLEKIKVGLEMEK